MEKIILAILFAKKSNGGKCEFTNPKHSYKGVMGEEYKSPHRDYNISKNTKEA